MNPGTGDKVGKGIDVALVTLAFLGIGYALGASYKSFEHDFRYVEYAIVVGIVAALAYFVYRRIAVAKVASRADDSSR